MGADERAGVKADREADVGGGSVRALLRPDIWGLAEYPAPEPLEEFAARQGMPVSAVVKLDQNENPYGPSPKVAAALAACSRYHVYPDPFGREARAALEGYVGVDRERIVVGNGSDELIEVLFRMFLQPGDAALTFGPTFGYYATVAGTCAARLVDVTRRPDWTIDLGAAIEALAAHDASIKVIVVPSPNNPTGTLVSLADVERLLATGRLVIVDEAYYEFSGWTALALAERHDNLVILRTLSKWAGLAGLRAGYGVLPEWLIRQLYKMKPPYGMSVAAAVALKASVEDSEYLLGTVAKIVEERGRLAAGLAATGYLRPYPSAANFILCDVLHGQPGEIQRHLEGRGILVRSYSDPRLRSCLRFSVGRPEQTDRLLAALSEMA